MKNPRTVSKFTENIFSGISMDHHPTSFFILENTQLGTFWVGQAKMILDENGYSLLPAVTQDKLIHKLETKYPEYESPNLDLVSINKNGTLPFYGVERWLSKLEYKLKKEPIKFKELKQLLTAGWHDHDFTNNSTLNVLHSRNKTDLKVLYRRLVDEWESKGLICLNTKTGKSYSERYEKCKKDPEFMYRRARKEVLRQMKKTGKLPKPETLMKYEIKEDCYINYMEEVPCEPCELPKFYKKGKYWYCLCNKRKDKCSNSECKILGAKLGIIVGASVCEHNKIRSRCKECGGASICKHNIQRSQCKPCGGSQICEHNKIRSVCKECGGASICEHNKIRSVCKECGGGAICEHGRGRSTCKECGGGAICEHNARRSQCKPCGGGAICEHDKHRIICKECGGSQICEHNKRHSQCNLCNPQSYIANLRRSRRWNVTNSPNPTHTLDDLCMTTGEWLKYLHKTFEDRYGRPKTEEDEVHIDEIIPCSAWDLPNDNKYCWHYLNSQWLLAEENLSKSDSYEEEDKLAMIERIQKSS
jgi:hypothetical protein